MTQTALIIKGLHEKSHVEKNLIIGQESVKLWNQMNRKVNFSLKTLCVLHACQTSENFLLKLDTGSETVWDSLEQNESISMWCFAYEFLPQATVSPLLVTHISVQIILQPKHLCSRWYYPDQDTWAEGLLKTHCSGNHLPRGSQKHVLSTM